MKTAINTSALSPMCTALDSIATIREKKKKKKKQPISVLINLMITHIKRVWPRLLITSFKIINNEKSRIHLNLRSYLLIS